MNPPRKTSPSRASQDKEAAIRSLDYGHLARLCLKYWKWLTGGIVAGVLAGLLFAASQTAIYAARATIFVQARDVNVPAVGNVGQMDAKSGDLLKTFEQLLQTRNLVDRVVKSEHLNESPEFLPKGAAPPISEGAASAMLASDVTIRIRPLTRLIDITVTHHSPHMAQVLANRLAQESVLQEFDQKAGSASVLSNYLQKEVERLQAKVSESEHALQDYQANHEKGGSLNDNEDVVDARLKDLNQQYINAQAQASLLKERYGESHPKLIQAEKAAEELQNEVNKAQEDARALNGQSIGYKALKSVAESYRLQLDNMLKALNDAEVAVHVEIPGISVAEEATSSRLVRPNRTEDIVVGGFVGMLCGMGFILGLYFVDTSIRTVSQAESMLGLPVIGAVPILRESEGSSILPTFSDPQSLVAESFRGLRASLILYDREHPLKTILVVSAVPGEGKSFCGANMAVAFAQAGLKTLLIDADLRLPTLHTYFNLPPGAENNGFASVLAGRATLDSVVVPSQIPALALLLTTSPADSPAELLSGIRLPLLLDEAARKYDRVVIDSAPINAVSDTMLIMQKADAILLVIRAAQTPASECREALQKIEGSKMKPLGLILNHIDPHTLKSYAYGYSYGQKPKEKNAKQVRAC